MKEIVDARPLNDVADLVTEATQLLKRLKRAEIADEHAQKEAQSTREEVQRARLDIGRMLVQARKQWPARGPRAKGWGEFLAEVGLSQQTAFNLMSIAGYVEDREVSQPGDSGCEIPSRREVERARREADAGPGERRATVEDERMSPAVDVPAWIAELANLIESMQRDIKSAFAKAERIEAMVTEHEASVASPSLLTSKSMLAAVRATVSDVLTKIGGRNGS